MLLLLSVDGYQLDMIDHSQIEGTKNSQMLATWTLSPTFHISFLSIYRQSSSGRIWAFPSQNSVRLSELTKRRRMKKCPDPRGGTTGIVTQATIERHHATLLLVSTNTRPASRIIDPSLSHDGDCNMTSAVCAGISVSWLKRKRGSRHFQEGKTILTPFDFQGYQIHPGALNTSLPILNGEVYTWLGANFKARFFLIRLSPWQQDEIEGESDKDKDKLEGTMYKSIIEKTNLGQEEPLWLSG